MSTSNTNTVVALKSAFLKAQTRTLSQPLQVPDQWLNNDGELQLRLAEDVLRHVNRLLRQHVKAAYSSLAIRHVAEQIDRLYWNAAEPSLNNQDDPNDIPRRDADLTSDEAISQLPSSWADPDTSISSDRRETQLEEFAEQSSYSSSLTQLRVLAERRAALRTRLDQLRKLKKMLEPFRDPQVNVQPSLVTTDGELAEELVRMRTLSARISERLAEGRRNGSGVVDDDGGGREVEEPGWAEAAEKMEGILASK